MLIFPINSWSGGLAKPLGALTREGLALVKAFLGPGPRALALLVQGPNAPTVSHAGDMQGRGFVPCACHSALRGGNWGFCEF